MPSGASVRQAGNLVVLDEPRFTSSSSVVVSYQSALEALAHGNGVALTCTALVEFGKLMPSSLLMRR